MSRAEANILRETCWHSLLQGVAIVLADLARRGQLQLAQAITEGLELELHDFAQALEKPDFDELRAALAKGDGSASSSMKRTVPPRLQIIPGSPTVKMPVLGTDDVENLCGS
jgi:hypothetical protein